MNYLDLFSGIGGFALGLQQAIECLQERGTGGADIQRGRDCPDILNGETGRDSEYAISKHYFSEIDKYAIQIYKRHFPDAIGLGSIVDINPAKLGRIDLITFGFPCQDLSIAGKRAGLQGRRSGLFFEATRLIRALRPSIFIFENVKGLLSSNDGQDFEAVLREIADIGIYECEWQLVNTAWVLPQNRERVYFIGHLGEGSGSKVFPIGENLNPYNGLQPEEDRQRTRIPCLNSRYGQRWNSEGYVKGRCPDSEVERETYMIDTRQMNREHTPRIYNDGKSATLNGTMQKEPYSIVNNNTIRRLTPTECCRLQGFPDDWCDGISDSQKYKCLGNAVSVPIVKMIAERLFRKDN